MRQLPTQSGAPWMAGATARRPSAFGDSRRNFRGVGIGALDSVAILKLAHFVNRLAESTCAIFASAQKNFRKGLLTAADCLIELGTRVLVIGFAGAALEKRIFDNLVVMTSKV